MSEVKLRHEDYTVGWICPLEVEQIAALEMLDKDHPALPQPPTDHNKYNLGNIGGHNVVIAGLPVTGNNSAAAVVTQMRTTFRELKFGLLVGIGGGVPTTTDNGPIRLGHIVVSKPAGEHSGAIQYDHGKAKVGVFERTGALAPPPTVLLNAAQDLAVKRARSENDPIVENIQRINTKIRGLKKYRHPGAAQDHLYYPDYVHRNPELSCAQCECDPNQRVKRDDDDVDEDDEDGPYVVVHRGTIASGELVIKDAALRDQLAKQYGVLCFEMEAAGALTDFPCMVIRGISDYSDSHKNNQWHGYAAAAAAAYARQLFFHMPIDEVKRYICSVERSVDHLVMKQDEQEHKTILNWLTTVNYANQQNDAIAKRQDGTGLWLLNSKEFKQWVAESRMTLFCPGIPGAGKTIMTSIVVEHLQSRFQSDTTIGIAYIYCNFRQQEQQKPQDLLSSLLKQFVQKQHPMPETMMDLYERHKDNQSRPSVGEISKTLHSVVAGYSRTFIIIDALDECQVSDRARNEFVRGLFDLQAKTGANLLVTSRSIPEITEVFKGSTTLKIHANDGDLHKYLDGNASELPSFVRKSPALQLEIETEIVKAANGMFLLARLHLESLRDKISIRDVRRALETLPRGSTAYDRAYQEAMERIQGQPMGFRVLAIRVLSWITTARRPLATLELRSALAVTTGASAFDQDNLTEVELIVSVCAGLVTVDEKSDIIRLVHYTTQEYFERTHGLWFPNAQTEMTEICVTYLVYDAFETGFCGTDEEFEARLQQNPLYDYAARNWGHHARVASTEALQLILGFLESEAKVSGSSQAMMAFAGYSGYSADVPRQMTGVHLAAYFGLEKVMSTFLTTKYDLDPKDTYNRTPLSWAAENGYDAVTKLLLSSGRVNPNSKGNSGLTPLSWAARYGHETVVKLLLAADGVDPDSKSNSGLTPLHWASENGHGAVVELLLATHRVDVNSKDFEHGRTPLSRAAENGHEVVVKLLLAVDQVDPDSKDITYSRTPLSWAAANGHEAVAKLLLSADRVDPNSTSSSGLTPLSWAARYGHETMAKLLLTAEGIDPDLPDNSGLTSLSWATRYGHETVVKLLLSTDRVDPNSKDNNSRTPLSWAATGAHGAVVQLLLATDRVDPDSKDNDGRTPLTLAAMGGHEGPVKQLLANASVDPDSKDKFGRTPLSWAAFYGRETIVKLLLVKDGVNPESKDTVHGQTPLWWAAENGHEGVVKQLLAKGGVNPDSKNKYGRTPLSWAATTGQEAVVKLLLATDGVDQNSRDNDGRTPLSWAAVGGHEAPVRQLLAKDGVDPDAKDNSGRTPLSWAACYGQEAAVKLLLATGRVDPNSKSKHGQTPLSLATANSYGAAIKPLFAAAKVKGIDIDSKNISSVVLQSTTKRGEEAKMLAGCLPPIFDFADHGVKSSVQRDWKITVTRNDMGQNSQGQQEGLRYLSSAPIGMQHLSELHPVRKVVFTITSKDQGWSSSPESHGTYENSWTWFEAVVRDGVHELGNGKVIVRNVHAGQEYKTHVVTWTFDAEDDDERIWVRNLKRGQHVDIVVWALYPGWENHVASARIDIFTAMVSLSCYALREEKFLQQ